MPRLVCSPPEPSPRDYHFCTGVQCFTVSLCFLRMELLIFSFNSREEGNVISYCWLPGNLRSPILCFANRDRSLFISPSRGSHQVSPCKKRVELGCLPGPCLMVHHLLYLFDCTFALILKNLPFCSSTPLPLKFRDFFLFQ